jgi:predicted transcriptional regulator
MEPEAANGKGSSHRRSLLELAPLELDCMNALWPMGEGTVREIRDRIAPHRPRAYTTIMTIMDRLARKGIVERRKAGRAYRYRPNLTAEEARAHALGQVLDGFFGGSAQAVIELLPAARPPAHADTTFRAMDESAAARPKAPAAKSSPSAPEEGEERSASAEPARLDTTLL